MLKQKLKTVLLVAAISGSNAAFADFYVGGQAGSVGWDDGNHAISYDIYAGYQFSQFLAAEIAYTDLGSFDIKNQGDTFSTSVAGASYSLVGILPLDDIFSLKGKVSYFDYKVSRELNNRSSSEADGGDFTFSAGVDINLAENTNLSLEYRYIPLKFDLRASDGQHEILSRGQTESADNLSVGLNFWF